VKTRSHPTSSLHTRKIPDGFQENQNSASLNFFYKTILGNIGTV